MEGDYLPTMNSNREAAIRTYQSYRYTVVTIANGAVPETIEAELWYLDGEKWPYFRRCTADTAVEAVRRVEGDFKEGADGRLEADGR